MILKIELRIWGGEAWFRKAAARNKECSCALPFPSLPFMKVLLWIWRETLQRDFQDSPKRTWNRAVWCVWSVNPVCSTVFSFFITGRVGSLWTDSSPLPPAPPPSSPTPWLSNNRMLKNILGPVNNLLVWKKFQTRALCCYAQPFTHSHSLHPSTFYHFSYFLSIF